MNEKPSFQETSPEDIFQEPPFSQHISPAENDLSPSSELELTEYIPHQEHRELEQEIQRTEETIQNIEQDIASLAKLIQEESSENTHQEPSPLQEKIHTIISQVQEEVKYAQHLWNLEGIETFFSANTLDRYSNPEQNETWNNPEILRANKQAYLQEIEKLATEKETWTPERLNQIPQIMKKLYHLPLMHSTDIRQFEFDIPELIELKSHKTLQSETPEEYQELGIFDSRGERIQTNTFTADQDIDRTGFVYASLGRLYIGPHNPENSDLTTFVLKPEILKESLTQHSALLHHLPNANTYHHPDPDNEFKKLIDSTLHSIDHLEVLATALATNLIDPSEIGLPEILIPRSVSGKSDVDLTLFSDEDSFQDENVLFLNPSILGKLSTPYLYQQLLQSDNSWLDQIHNLYKE